MPKFFASLALVLIVVLTVATVAHADEPSTTIEPTTTTTTVTACVDEYHGPGGAVEEIPCDQWSPCPGVMFGMKVPTKYFPARCPAPTTTTSAAPPPSTVPQQGNCPVGQYDPNPSAPPPHTCLPLPTAATAAPPEAVEPAAVAETTTTVDEAPVSAPARKKPTRRKAAAVTTTVMTSPVQVVEVGLLAAIRTAVKIGQ